MTAAALQRLPAAPLPLERLSGNLIPDELTGMDGTNRDKNNVNQLAVDTDIEAVWLWLRQFENSPNTFRSYRKEIERFYNWVLFRLHKPLSSVVRTDYDLYRTFLSDPAPAHFWQIQTVPRKDPGLTRRSRTSATKMAQKNPARTSANWRPFHGPLKPSSAHHASVVIGAFFSFLCEANYLSGNPWPVIRKKKSQHQVITEHKLIAPSAGTEAGSPEQVQSPTPPDSSGRVEFHVLQQITQFLEQKADASSGREKAKFERMLFVFRFLFATGVRREELAQLRMWDMYSQRNIRTQQVKWLIRVIGKGGKERLIGANPVARQAIIRYHQSLGMPGIFAGNKMPMLRPLAMGKKSESTNPLTSQVVYSTVLHAVSLVLEENVLESSEDRENVKNACLSPHWFRHMLTTYGAQMGIPLDKMQQQLGHDSIETTANVYRHLDPMELAEVMELVVI